jgi:hypothetical protein
MHRLWVAPDLSFATQILRFDLDSAMRSGAEEYIRDTLSNYVEQRSVVSASSRMELEGMSTSLLVQHLSTPVVEINTAAYRKQIQEILSRRRPQS